MAKETEKRLIKTLEFLKEPHGSTITTIVKAINGEGPEVSLKKIVQTLRGCLKNGILKLSEGRVKFKELDLAEDSEEKVQSMDSCGNTKNECSNLGCSSKPFCTSKMCKPKCMKLKNLELPKPCCLNNEDSFNGYISSSKICVVDGEPPEGGGEGGEGGNGEPDAGKNKKKKPRCRKPKPKCKKKKPKCPKPKPKCPKPKPKCPKPKPKCPKPKPKCPKKCGKRKIQPYCKKKKKTEF